MKSKEIRSGERGEIGERRDKTTTRIYKKKREQTVGATRLSQFCRKTSEFTVICINYCFSSFHNSANSESISLSNDLTRAMIEITRGIKNLLLISCCSGMKEYAFCKI